MKTSTKLTIAAAAMTGLLAGAAARSTAAPVSAAGQHAQAIKKTLQAKAGVKALADDADKHDCKGKNDCKGKGGCKTGDNGCKGKNSCKGKGGCKTENPGL